MGNRQNISVHYGRIENLEYKRINRIVVAKPTSDIENRFIKLLSFKINFYGKQGLVRMVVDSVAFY